MTKRTLIRQSWCLPHMRARMCVYVCRSVFPMADATGVISDWWKQALVRSKMPLVGPAARLFILLNVPTPTSHITHIMFELLNGVLQEVAHTRNIPYPIKYYSSCFVIFQEFCYFLFKDSESVFKTWFLRCCVYFAEYISRNKCNSNCVQIKWILQFMLNILGYGFFDFVILFKYLKIRWF